MKQKKPFYKRGWFIILVVIVIVGMVSTVRTAIKKSSEQNMKYTWPNSALANLIPQPDSKNGKVNMENEEYLQVDVYKISKEQFELYTDSCKDCGFVVGYTKMDEYYSAENKDGYTLMISYNGKEKILKISLNAPSEEISDEGEQESEDLPDKNKVEELMEKPEKSGEAEEPKDAEPEDTDSDDIRPEFKETLDTYEEFMDEYCEFMETYNDSSDLSMLKKYNELMSKYTEFLEKIDALGEEPMNDAEAKYYLEVTSRASQRMLEVSQ